MSEIDDSCSKISSLIKRYLVYTTFVRQRDLLLLIWNIRNLHSLSCVNTISFTKSIMDWKFPSSSEALIKLKWTSALLLMLTAHRVMKLNVCLCSSKCGQEKTNLNTSTPYSTAIFVKIVKVHLMCKTRLYFFQTSQEDPTRHVHIDWNPMWTWA